VRLIVYNVMGQQVRGLINANQNAGAYSVRWNGRDNQGQSVATEMYIYRLDAGANVAMNKMLLVK
jgi:flagellar hook assembly protein FlgD